jgi:hypothetical protein
MTHFTPPTPPDLRGGTHAPRPETYQSPFLRAHADALAHDATRRFYERWPELVARYGERGRQHTYDDQFWHLSTLDAAIAADSPPLFEEYVAWLRGFLAGRGMGDDIAKANFTFFHEAVSALPAEMGRDEVLALLDRAIAAF